MSRVLLTGCLFLIVGCEFPEFGTSSTGVPSTSYCDDVSAWDAVWLDWETEVLAIVNEERSFGAVCGGQSFGPAGPLSGREELVCAARKHSKDMAESDYFAHVNLQGQSPFDRMQEAGYSFSTAGENIAAGQQSPQAVMQAWMNSPGHCSNIMNPSFTELGVGYYQGNYWTQNFGTPR